MEKVKLEKNCPKKRKIANLDWHPNFVPVTRSFLNVFLKIHTFSSNQTATSVKLRKPWSSPWIWWARQRVVSWMVLRRYKEPSLMPSDEVPMWHGGGWLVGMWWRLVAGWGREFGSWRQFFVSVFLSEPTIDPKMYDVFFLMFMFSASLIYTSHAFQRYETLPGCVHSSHSNLLCSESVKSRFCLARPHHKSCLIGYRTSHLHFIPKVTENPTNLHRNQSVAFFQKIIYQHFGIFEFFEMAFIYIYIFFLNQKKPSKSSGDRIRFWVHFAFHASFRGWRSSLSDPCQLSLPLRPPSYGFRKRHGGGDLQGIARFGRGSDLQQKNTRVNMVGFWMGM